MLKQRVYFMALFLAICPGNAPVLAQGNASSSDQQQLRFYESKVRPILVAHCSKCHSGEPKKTKGGLNLDSRAGWLKGGDSGAAVAPGAPEKSILFKAVNYQSENLRMPPDGKI